MIPLEGLIDPIEESKRLTKKIEKISDLLWNFPQGFTDRTNVQSLDKLEIGKIQTIKVKILKYNFPRIRNLPNKVVCCDDKGKIDIVFFNSREGYIRNVLPLNSYVIISGKINYFKSKYQITNPDYVTSLDKQEYVIKSIPKYSLTKGINEKKYRLISDQVIDGVEKTRPAIMYDVGEQVKVIDGPFASFNGEIDETVFLETYGAVKVE